MRSFGRFIPLALVTLAVAVLPFAGRADEPGAPASLALSNAVAEAGSGPAHLQQRTRVVVSTNLLPTADVRAATNLPPKSFDWHLA
jgi:hypothetical protein